MELFKFMIIELLGLLKTFRRPNITLNIWNIVKKSAHSKCCLKSEKMVKFCSKVKKCSRVLEM